MARTRALFLRWFSGNRTDWHKLVLPNSEMSSFFNMSIISRSKRNTVVDNLLANIHASCLKETKKCRCKFGMRISGFKWWAGSFALGNSSFRQPDSSHQLGYPHGKIGIDKGKKYPPAYLKNCLIGISSTGLMSQLA